jgi:tetratricopeptide (TPR) repeat protein
MQDDANGAIRAALDGRWDEAIKLNQEILKNNPKDLEALNRLAKSYLEKGLKNEALKTVREALKIDPYNPITLKLKCRLDAGLPSKNQPADNYATISTFIEEPGKTRSVTLINCAPPKKIGAVECAQKLQLVPKRHTVHVCDGNGNYLGMLPDDLGKRLNLLMKAGNCYLCLVKTVGTKDLTVFIRETVRSKKYSGIPSFPAKISMDHIADHADEILAEEEKRVQKTPNRPVSKSEAEEEDDDGLPSAKIIHQDEEPEE